jgi:hypothetical protein
MRHFESAFILRNGEYEYMMMYFGLIEDLTYYMDYLDKFAMVLINDILVYSKDEE